MVLGFRVWGFRVQGLGDIKQVQIHKGDINDGSGTHVGRERGREKERKRSRERVRGRGRRIYQVRYEIWVYGISRDL